jgi:thiamine biosynthesis lipoprotein
MIKPHIKLIFLSVIFLGVFIACSQPKNEIHLTGPTMGTTYNIKYVIADSISADELKKLVDAELVLINQLMSTYIKDSELSRFNQWDSLEAFPMSEQTLQVLSEAKRLSAMSEGLLDVTVGPLVNLWGFGPQNRPEKIPSSTQIIQAKNRIGIDKLTLGDTWAKKSQTDLYVDLSTIAKGYGVDQLALLLEQHNITDYLVEVGGEMRLSGVKASGKAWSIAIEKPETHTRSVPKIMSVGNNAVATSGDYRIYYEENGVRYSHLIDPDTGYPIKHNLVSVTVVHPSSMTADGLATALNVMGKEKALALAEKHDLAVLMITKEKQGFTEYTSAMFDQLVTVH